MKITIQRTIHGDTWDQTIDFNEFCSNPEYSKAFKQFLEALTLQAAGSSIKTIKLENISFTFESLIILRRSHKWSGDVIPEFQSKSVGKGSFGEVYLTTPHLKEHGFGRFEKKELKEKVVKQPLKAVNEDKLKSEFEKTKALFPNTQIPEELGEKPPIMMPYFGTDLYAVSRTSENLDRCGYNDCNMRLHLISMGLEHLNEIHQKGFVHRDIKTKNMMLLRPSTENLFCDELRFVDMGVSMKSGDIQEGYSGTIEYVAPEQFWADNDPAEKTADYYSYAVVMIKMLYGEELSEKKEKKAQITWTFQNEYQNNIEKRIKAIKALFQEDTSLLEKSQKTIMKNLILAMLNEDPKKRPSMEVIRFALILASSNKNYINFLSNPLNKLDETEKTKLFFLFQPMIKDDNFSKSIKKSGIFGFFQKIMLWFFLRRYSKWIAKENDQAFIQNFENGLSSMTQKNFNLDNNRCLITKNILKKGFKASFDSMNLNLAIEDENITINDPILFAKSYDVIKGDCLKYAAQLKNQYGIDYKKADIMNHLDQFYAYKIKAITEPNIQIDYYRSLHKSTQAKVKDMIVKGDLNIPSYKLEASFHTRINSVEEAEKFMKDKPNRYYIIYQDKSGQLYLVNRWKDKNCFFEIKSCEDKKGYDAISTDHENKITLHIESLSEIPHRDGFDEKGNYTFNSNQLPIREKDPEKSNIQSHKENPVNTPPQSRAKIASAPDSFFSNSDTKEIKQGEALPRSQP